MFVKGQRWTHPEQIKCFTVTAVVGAGEGRSVEITLPTGSRQEGPLVLLQRHVELDDRFQVGSVGWQLVPGCMTAVDFERLIGRLVPWKARGWLAEEAYRLHIIGERQLLRTLAATRTGMVSGDRARHK